MTTVQKIEKLGYKVTFAMSGRTVWAEKGMNIRYSARNVTELLKRIKIYTKNN